MSLDAEVAQQIALIKAKEIVIREELPSGDPPRGMNYTSKNINHCFFDPEEETLRDDLVALNMPFLHALMTSKLVHAGEVRAKEQEKRKAMRKSPQDAEDYVDDEDYEEVILDEDKEERGENDLGLDTVMGQTIEQKDNHRLRKVSTAI